MPAQLDRVISLVDDVLGGDLVGAYLHGSAVLGGLRPPSDLDVLAVVKRRTTVDEKWRLVDALLRLSAPPATSPALRPVELTIVVHDDVRPWRYPPMRDFQYGDWLRSAFERGELGGADRQRDPDLAVLLAIARRGDAAIVGPPPADVLDPVPQRDVIAAMVEAIESLLEDLDSDTRNVVLTLARIWHTTATGEITTKDRAADWALPRLEADSRAVLERARAGYLRFDYETWDDMRTLVDRYVVNVTDEIGRLTVR